MKELENARQKIDEIDRQMAALFEARMAAVRQVAAYKASCGMPILDQGREQQVIEKNLTLLHDQTLAPFYKEYICCQMALSRRYQAEFLNDSAQTD